MTNVAIDVGKKKSYFVIEQNGMIVKECYVATSRESFSSILGEYPGSSVVMEASSTIDRIAPYVEAYTSDITVAHPMKLKVISQLMELLQFLFRNCGTSHETEGDLTEHEEDRQE